MSPFEPRHKANARQSRILANSIDSRDNQIATPTLSRQTVQRSSSLPQALRPVDVQVLQRSMGNVAVGNLLGRNQSPPQPTVVQRQPLTNTIQRNTDDELSESDIESDTESDAEELEEEEMSSAGTPQTAIFREMFGIADSAPDYQSSPDAVTKKMGLRSRLWHKALRSGARVMDSARNKVTGGESSPLTNRAAQKEQNQRSKVDQKLMWEHYDSYLSPSERKQARKQRRQDLNLGKKVTPKKREQQKEWQQSEKRARRRAKKGIENEIEL